MQFEFNWLEWGGAAMGLYGAYLIARNKPNARYGWYFFLAANVLFIAFAIDQHHYGLLVQQLGFTCTSLLGIYNSIVALHPVPTAKTIRTVQSQEDYYANLDCKDTCNFFGDHHCRECEKTSHNRTLFDSTHKLPNATAVQALRESISMRKKG